MRERERERDAGIWRMRKRERCDGVETKRGINNEP